MSDSTQNNHQNGAEPTTLPEVKIIPEKKSVEPKAIPTKATEAKAVPPAKGGGAGAVPKKPAKKVVKSWPSVNALITALSLTATLGGWAHFTVQEMRRAEAEAAAWAASQAVVSPAAPASAEIAPSVVLTSTLDIALPPIPTVVPAQTFNINSSVPVDTAAVAPAPASAAPVAAPAAPVLRSVSAPPPPVVSAPAPAPAAPAPAASTSSSR
jgi:hypothetical protein